MFLLCLFAGVLMELPFLSKREVVSLTFGEVLNLFSLFLNLVLFLSSCVCIYIYIFFLLAPFKFLMQVEIWCFLWIFFFFNCFVCCFRIKFLLILIGWSFYLDFSNESIFSRLDHLDSCLQGVQSIFLINQIGIMLSFLIEV